MHDAGLYEKPLPVGAIFTVEPGVYLPEQGFGVRIEDEVIVTPTGYPSPDRGFPEEARGRGGMGRQGAEVATASQRVSLQGVNMRSLLLVISLIIGFASGALALSAPPAIFTDPPADKAHPAAMTVLHIPSHGLLINGLLYSPAGAGPHPTLVICHGLPGNEKNLDLAQAVRRAGWNAVTFNYRGSWGSPGSFRFAQNPEDADAVLKYLRDPANASKLGIDPKRIAIAGHSMGGWVVAHTAARDHALIGRRAHFHGGHGARGRQAPSAGGGRDGG